MSKRRAVPFTPVIKSDQDQAEQVAEQLNMLIEEREKQGWRFCHLESIVATRRGTRLTGELAPTVAQVAIFERDSSG